MRATEEPTAGRLFDRRFSMRWLARSAASAAVTLVPRWMPSEAQAQTCTSNWLPGFGFQQPEALNDAVKSLSITPDQQLLAAGSFTLAGGAAAPYAAKWNGHSWSAPSVYLEGTGASAAVMMPNGDIVVGGSVSPPNSPGPLFISRWNGTSWAPMGTGMDNYVEGLALLPAGDLIAVGMFQRAGGVLTPSIARWNGAAWTAFDRTGLPAGMIDAIQVTSDTGVVVGGALLNTGFVARWNGATWSQLGDSMDGAVASVLALDNGDIIAGGSFRHVGSLSASGIALWNGTGWSAMDSGMGPPGTGVQVNALALMHNGDIVAGGRFTTAGGAPANSIASWDGAAWHPLGSGVVTSGGTSQGVYALAVLPSGDLAVGGIFGMAGGIPSLNFGIWHTSCLSTCDADFNHDGDAGTDADIEAFFACIAGDCCTACGSPDFNGDGDSATDADIESFFRVLAGGPC